MCQNKEVSFIIFIFALTTIINMFINYDSSKNPSYLYTGMYLIGLALMQLVEFFIHLNLSMKEINNQIDKFLGYMVFLTILIQFSLMVYCIYKTEIIPKIANYALSGIFASCMLILFIYVVRKGFNNNKINCESIICKLQWGILDELSENKKTFIFLMIAMLIHTAYICISTYTIFTEPVFIAFMILTGTVMVIPTFISLFGKAIPLSKGLSSTWCLTTLIIIIIALLVPDKSLIIKNISQEEHV